MCIQNIMIIMIQLYKKYTLHLSMIYIRNLKEFYINTWYLNQILTYTSCSHACMPDAMSSIHKLTWSSKWIMADWLLSCGITFFTLPNREKWLLRMEILLMLASTFLQTMAVLVLISSEDKLVRRLVGRAEELTRRCTEAVDCRALDWSSSPVLPENEKYMWLVLG